MQDGLDTPGRTFSFFPEFDGGERRGERMISGREIHRLATPWSFVNGNEAVEVIVSGPFIANDSPTMLGAAVEGLGLAQVPESIAAGAVKTGKLVRVLEPFAA